MKKVFRQIFENELKMKSLAVLAGYLCLMIFAAFFFQKYVNKDVLQELVGRSGQFGIIIFFLIEVVYVTFTPLLNTAILILAGYIFGGLTGFFINFLANTAGLFLIVFLVRKYGRSLLKKVVSKNFYDKFDSLAEKIGPMILFVVYVLPFTPDDELTYIVAAGPIKFRRFILPILLGNIAKSAYSFIGENATTGIAIAASARIIMLIVGLVLVGLQEYVMERKLIGN